MTQEISPRDLVPIGVTGLKHSRGFLNEEFIRDLRGNKGMRTYRQMFDNDPTIGAFSFAMEMLIRQANWMVNPASDEPEAKRWSEFADQCMHDMSRTWQEFLTEALTMMPFGYSWHEVLYKYRRGQSVHGLLNSRHDDGLVGWRDLPIRAQESLERWHMDDRGNVLGMVQRDPNTGASYEIPRDKALHFRVRSIKNNPEGRSLLRNAYRPWFFKTKIEEIEAIGVERDLAGMPVVRLPPDAMADASTKAHYERFVSAIRRNEWEGVVFPASDMPDGQKTGYDLSLLSSGGRRPQDVNEIIKRYDQRIAMTVLADFILLGQDKVGSYALADSKTSVFAMSLQAILETIVGEFNRKAIPDLMSFNGVPRKYWPELSYGDLEKIDFTAFGALATQMVQAGFLVPQLEDEEHIRDMMGLPSRNGGASAGRQDNPQNDDLMAQILSGAEDASDDSE